jgi:hypothetical protein
MSASVRRIITDERPVSRKYAVTSGAVLEISRDQSGRLVLAVWSGNGFASALLTPAETAEWHGYILDVTGGFSRHARF